MTDDRRQNICARLAGFLFLWLIVTGLGGAVTIGRIAKGATFPEVAARVAASELLYRAALCSELIETLSAAVLAFALYVVLRPVDKLLAQFAMYWRLGESFVGAIGVLMGFVRLRMYSLEAQQAEALVDIARHAGRAATNISAIFFSVGSLLFFLAFLKSTYLPRALSALGVFASVVTTVMCFATLVFPRYGATLQYGWAPMAVAEVATGVWLIIFGAKRRPVTA
jgi:hypothetical protein